MKIAERRRRAAERGLWGGVNRAIDILDNRHITDEADDIIADLKALRYLISDEMNVAVAYHIGADDVTEEDRWK